MSDQAALVPKPTGTNQRSLVTMTSAEVDEFLRGNHTLTVCTIGPTGDLHAVAMWYGYVDGAVHMEAKRKSQKVKNLERDNRLTISIHDGYLYDEMRGVTLQGTGEILTDDSLMRRVVDDIFQRYHGIDEPDPNLIEPMLKNRILIRLHPTNVISWDHRKLAQKP